MRGSSGGDGGTVLKIVSPIIANDVARKTRKKEDGLKGLILCPKSGGN